MASARFCSGPQKSTKRQKHCRKKAQKAQVHSRKKAQKPMHLFRGQKSTKSTKHKVESTKGEGVINRSFES
jgi:hypothetical protein